MIDKRLAPKYLSSGIFTVNSDVCSLSSEAVSIDGHNLSFRICVKYTGSDTSDTDMVMGYINFSAVGVTRFPNSRYYCNGYNEGSNASIGYSVMYDDGEIKYRYGTIATD